eukprot:7971539-Pyramimonas_sp.AAC.1
MELSSGRAGTLRRTKPNPCRYLTSPSWKTQHAYITPLRPAYPTRLTLVPGVVTNDTTLRRTTPR